MCQRVVLVGCWRVLLEGAAGGCAGMLPALGEVRGLPVNFGCYWETLGTIGATGNPKG